MLSSGLPIVWTLFICGSVLRSTPALAQDRLQVFVSIAPQAYFVERIGGDRVDVQVMVPSGGSPHTYEPKPQQMLAIARCQVYFAIGVSFEKVWLDKISAANRRMLLVHTQDGVATIAMAGHHADDGRHEHPADPHIWLAPPLVKEQARHILAALGALDPGHKTTYQANYGRFSRELDQLHADLQHILAGHRTKAFMVFHPSWGVFAHTYGLKQVSIETEGKEPKPAQLQALIEQAQNHDIKVIFAQPQLSTKSAQVVADAIGGRVVLVDPLAADWKENLINTAKAFRQALR